jgi:NifU-like protein involved in Fe-S cluster formation
MTYSASSQPDLDWSQVRETIKLLTVSVAQVHSGMKIGDESVNVLTGSFSSMVQDMNAIRDSLNAMPASPERDTALAHCLSTQERIHSSIIAFQFYDRLQQCLSHVATGLTGLSAIIDSPKRLYNPMEWHQFQNEIRSHYTMESEKAMFDAILHGKSIEEALAIAESFHQSENDDIELF